MTTAQDIVNRLDDSQSIMMAKVIHDRIFSTLDFNAIADNVQGDSTGERLLELDDIPQDAEFNVMESVTVSKRFLSSIASDENLSILISDAWQELKNNDQLFVGATIAVGLMVNLTLFMVSSKIEFKIGNLKIKKDKVDSEAVKSIMEFLSKLINKLPTP